MGRCFRLIACAALAIRRQAEQELHLRKAPEGEMPDLEHRPPEQLHELPRHDDLPAELPAEPLDAAGEVDIAADDREVQPVARTDVAVGNRAVVERKSGDEGRGTI